ncbi:MAG TPA: hypothetical protein VF461_21385 [Gemmatimonadaceae bacterium]
MMQRTLTSSFVCLALLSLPAVVRAQGTLSTQGFGYPTGEMSTRAIGAGGATSDFDAFSSTNPASIAASLGSMLYVQVEPEYRHLTNDNGGTQKNVIARHPLASLAIQVRPSLFFGVSVSNFLDRSFETQERRTTVVADTAIASTNNFKSDGAIGDTRAGLAWTPTSWLRLGVAGHVISGSNRLRSTQAFDDSARFAAIADTQTVTYVGSALSAGVQVFAGQLAAFAVSYRKGNSMSVKHQDTTLATANVPDGISMSAAFIGIKGSMLAVRTSRNSWTRMEGLGSDSLPITNSWDTSVGADVLGPHIGSHVFQLRAGGRWRTLPFGLVNSQIKENTYNFGTGTLLAQGRLGVDFAAIRAVRTPVNNVVPFRESAWTMSFGVTVRP